CGARRMPTTARDEERRLRQAERGTEGGWPKSAAGKCPRKRVERLAPDRFGAVVGGAPCTQIERVAIGFGDPAHAQVVGKIRRAASGRAVARDGEEPARRALQKRGRRHQIRRASAV